MVDSFLRQGIPEVAKQLTKKSTKAIDWDTAVKNIRIKGLIFVLNQCPDFASASHLLVTCSCADDSAFSNNCFNSAFAFNLSF